MNSFYRRSFQSAVSYLSIGLLATTSFAFAQESASPAYPQAEPQQQAANPGGWRRVGDSTPVDQSAYPQYNDQAADQNQPPPVDNNGPYAQPPAPQASYGQQQPNYQQPNYQQQPSYPQQQPNYSQQGTYNNQQRNYPAPPPVPAQITVPAGTYITVRLNQVLSTDRNQPGDAFTANLVEPVVANGVVVAEPGQTIAGRVAESQKAGRVEGVARLGIELTSLSAVDGQQIPIHSQLISRKGNTSVGRDAGAIAGTTALGAIIGAAAGWGTGAAIGAGAGAVAGTIGVLVTRGHPSVLYPEQILTFRLEAPITVVTSNAPQAFRYIEPGEYDRAPYNQPGPGAYTSAGPGPAPYAYGGGYGYGYPYPYYAYGYGYPYSGSGFGFYFGPGFYGRGYYGGFRGGYYGGRYYGGGARISGGFARGGSGRR